ncbi:MULTISPECIES: hypothetical protein [Pseudomonas]|jgi:hypothetical protein|uniref:Uncharacterized protein n=1 Tax=Pseudomonas mosselii TaxID=78327 RepID=A0A5R8YT08_9PSED|nr:hypothetical protein [Pseudomonas mosselii]TLP56599.1 hypothetical protein FEM01_17990 [Pseudomonas mosselii]
MSYPADVPAAPDLQRFLDEEGTCEALAHLLEKALAARRNRLVDAYRGNAYTVSFEDEDVIIEWYSQRKMPAQHLPLDRFIALLRAWPGA